MSVESEIIRLQTAKADLKTSIEDKGVTVPSNTKLDGYADLVDSIETGGGGSSSDEWLYYSATGVKVIQSGFMDTFLDCSNTSNLTVERIVSDGNFSCHYGTWWADWQISDEPFTSSYVDAWFRIKPNNMSVGDTGTLTINLLNRTCIITFKLTETFSEEQMYYQGTDIQKLEIVSAPYIVNPLNGASFGGSDRGGGTYTHQYQLSSGNVVDAYLAKNSFYHYSEPSSTRERDQLEDENKHIKSISSNFFPYRLEINNSGLLTLTLESADYKWESENRPIIFVILISDEGYTFIDDFDIYCKYPCFVKGIKIILFDGEKKAVEDITYDDELLVWNFDDGRYDKAKPLWIKKTQTTTWYYKLKFSNGLELKVTGTYPEAHSLFSVEDGKFIHANKLVGKKVYTLDGIATLESCEEVHENVEFYNIITNYHMNLFANSVLTSTSLNNLYPIKNMVFVKEDREPTFGYSMFDRKWVNGLRLSEQPKDVTDYCNNLIRLQLKN